jgi:hypothetical protein
MNNRGSGIGRRSKNFSQEYVKRIHGIPWSLAVKFICKRIQMKEGNRVHLKKENCNM